LVLDPQHARAGPVIAHLGGVFPDPVLDGVVTGRGVVGQDHGDLPAVDVDGCGTVRQAAQQHLHAVRHDVVLGFDIEGGRHADLGFDALGQLCDEVVDVFPVFAAGHDEGIGAGCHVLQALNDLGADGVVPALGGRPVVSNLAVTAHL